MGSLFRGSKNNGIFFKQKCKDLSCIFSFIKSFLIFSCMKLCFSCMFYTCFSELSPFSYLFKAVFKNPKNIRHLRYISTLKTIVKWTPRQSVVRTHLSLPGAQLGTFSGDWNPTEVCGAARKQKPLVKS